MPINDTQITDHESILLLRQDVKALKESQDNFHVEMKESFKDLKDNYATRLDLVEKELSEAARVYVAKDEEDKKDAILGARVSALETVRNIGVGFSILATVCAGLITYIYFQSQGYQDARINSILTEVQQVK